MSQPIRVGFIGLNSSAAASLAGQWGKNAHLPYLQKTEQYIITALCNSSIASAQKAIKQHGLDSSKVHAHGDPVSLANDPDVDFVVCCVRVPQHYDLVKPAIEAGKDVYCEWPLASNLEQMEELASLAKAKNVKTIVGLQGRNGAYVRAINNIVREIGPVLSTSLTAQEQVFGLLVPQDIEYLTRIESGANLMTIDAIHLLDTLTATLGDIQSYNSVVKNTWPTVSLIDQDRKVVVPKHPDTTHDHILLQGTLEGNIPFNLNLRGGPPFKNTPGFEWRVLAAKGEIRITVPSVHIWTSGNIKVEVFNHDTDEVLEVDLRKVDEGEPGHEYASPGNNIAKLYDAFAKGQTERYLDFEQSLKWARLIQDLYNTAAN